MLGEHTGVEVAMIDWEWTWEQANPDDVLDAARAISVTDRRMLMDLPAHWGWVSARVYLSWASGALERGGHDGWDAAAAYAKRAACRQMDGILANNHLSGVLGRNYKDKARFLADLKVPGLGALRELVIDPRNDIEHEYALATEDQARRAYDIAELFLGATDGEAETPAVLGLGWAVPTKQVISLQPGNEYHYVEFGLTRETGPLLLVDYYTAEPAVLVLLPQEQVLRHCPLRELQPEQAIALNRRLRECLQSSSYSSMGVTEEVMKQLKEQFKL
jgi:hypothetical protein